jgi:hypothetical protein
MLANSAEKTGVEALLRREEKCPGEDFEKSPHNLITVARGPNSVPQDSKMALEIYLQPWKLVA